MAKKDLRREQIKLLRFEKTLHETMKGKITVGAGLAAIAAALAPLRGVSQSVEDKLSDPKVGEMSEAIFGASEASQADLGVYLQNLASVVRTAHAYVEEQAINAGFRLFQADGGPKQDPPSILNLLGLG